MCGASGIDELAQDLRHQAAADGSLVQGLDEVPGDVAQLAVGMRRACPQAFDRLLGSAALSKHDHAFGLLDERAGVAAVHKPGRGNTGVLEQALASGAVDVQSVVDIGSGAGKFCVAAALGSGCRFTGLEQRPRLVAAARTLAAYTGEA